MDSSGRTLLLILLLLSLPAQAHRLKVFAYAEGNSIQGRVYFVGGVAAPGARLSILDDQNRLIDSISPDTNGEFHYRITEPMTHILSADVGDGHMARWTVNADEFSTSPIALLGEAHADTPAQPQSDGPHEQQGLNESRLADVVEQAVTRQLIPLRKQLVAYEERARLQDIIGGIGYIVGIAGIALWWRSRKRQS